MFHPRSFHIFREPDPFTAPLVFRPLEDDLPRPPIAPLQIALGISLACALGVGLGLWVRADIDRRAAMALTPPARPVTPAPAQQAVRIVLAKAEETLPHPTSLLDVGVTAPAAVRPAPEVTPSFDCLSARTLADQMVCVDPALAEADRRMAQAYRAAAAVGVAYPALARDQARWLAARQAAAQTSPEALASLYETRIAELSPKENPARPAPSGVHQAHLADANVQPVS